MYGLGALANSMGSILEPAIIDAYESASVYVCLYAYVCIYASVYVWIKGTSQ